MGALRGRALLCVLWILPGIGWADSSGPRLAAYYDLFLALCGNVVYELQDAAEPQRAFSGAVQVGVGADNRYALTPAGDLLTWDRAGATARPIASGVRTFHAGKSGVLLIRDDGSLWSMPTESVFGVGERIGAEITRIAEGVITAAVGDSADYYVHRDGRLFVRGRAHRGQYGDGRLQSSANFISTAVGVVQVVAHTGHALLLKRDGGVWGTGGNIYGPLGHHGFGDKSIRWQPIVDGVRAIATGSSHSLAIGADGSLMTWGRNEGLDPKPILKNVLAAAAGSDRSIALADGWLWQWPTGHAPARVMACP